MYIFSVKWLMLDLLSKCHEIVIPQKNFFCFALWLSFNLSSCLTYLWKKISDSYSPDPLFYRHSCLSEQHWDLLFFLFFFAFWLAEHQLPVHSAAGGVGHRHRSPSGPLWSPWPPARFPVYMLLCSRVYFGLSEVSKWRLQATRKEKLRCGCIRSIHQFST